MKLVAILFSLLLQLAAAAEVAHSEEVVHPEFFADRLIEGLQPTISAPNEVMAVARLAIMGLLKGMEKGQVPEIDPDKLDTGSIDRFWDPGEPEIDSTSTGNRSPDALTLFKSNHTVTWQLKSGWNIRVVWVNRLGDPWPFLETGPPPTNVPVWLFKYSEMFGLTKWNFAQWLKHRLLWRQGWDKGQSGLVELFRETKEKKGPGIFSFSYHIYPKDSEDSGLEKFTVEARAQGLRDWYQPEYPVRPLRVPDASDDVSSDHQLPPFGSQQWYREIASRIQDPEASNDGQNPEEEGNKIQAIKNEPEGGDSETAEEEKQSLYDYEETRYDDDETKDGEEGTSRDPIDTGPDQGQE